MKSTLSLSNIGAALLLLTFVGACDGSSTDGKVTSDGGDSSGNSDGGDSGGDSNGDSSGNSGGGTGAAGSPVKLGTAGDFVILAKSGISTVPTSAVTGDIGVSPAAATYITGFSLTADATMLFATSTQVVGKVYSATYKAPTPAKLTTAVSDMELAFTDASGRAPDKTELGAGNIGGMTLAPGVYKWGTGLLITSDVTLEGSATDVWIFQIAQGMTMSSATKVLLKGGALAKNIFWQAGGAVELGTTAHCEGVILTKTAITLRTGASVNGRLLAQSQVRIDGSKVTQP